ncbi:hypothetical protein M404DRAFT_25996 [Pisolithus tinctorius Marx 270]|uniref:Uncharacterized protein n=1 Tax=Pisolithus tinctorius Marx 270 TaxID=870435 RepID=A0A0C3K5S1_PISTI|nr:hypothetical protein M404DRAFT_25996 [Pisolithus tinctorius Marx 270]
MLPTVRSSPGPVHKPAKLESPLCFSLPLQHPGGYSHTTQGPVEKLEGFLRPILPPQHLAHSSGPSSPAPDNILSSVSPKQLEQSLASSTSSPWIAGQRRLRITSSETCHATEAGRPPVSELGNTSIVISLSLDPGTCRFIVDTAPPGVQPFARALNDVLDMVKGSNKIK